MVIFVLLLINLFLVLFQFSYKLWYLFLYKIWNSFFFKKLKSYVILDLNLFSTEWLNYGNLSFNKDDFKKLSFTKKYILSVYPDVTNQNWSYNNTSVTFLSEFGEKNFPIINEIVENNFHLQHKTSLKDFNKLCNFLLISNFSNSNFKNFMLKNFRNDNKSIFYNLYNFIFFLENNFYYSITSKHFFNISKRNFVKFNFLFLFFLKNINNKNYVFKYTLDNVYDWYNFNSDGLKFFKPASFFKSNLDESTTFLFSKFDFSNIYLSKNASKILSFNNNINNGLKIFLTDLVFNFKNLNDRLFNVNTSLLNSFKINFSEASTNKHINLNNNFLKRSNFVFFFLRKNKIFNKGRYSRNRQTYRTGFYWCLWVNIFAIYGLHYLFYRFTFAFGYLWVPFIIFFGSFLFSRMLKYNFHNFKFIFSEVSNFCTWFGFLFTNFYNLFLKIFLNFSNFFKSVFFFSNFVKKNNFFGLLFNFFFNFYSIFFKNLNSLENTHVWYYLSSKDDSFFSLSSKIFFLNQFFLKNK